MTIVASPSLGFVTQKVMPLSLSYPQLSKISQAILQTLIKIVKGNYNWQYRYLAIETLGEIKSQNEAILLDLINILIQKNDKDIEISAKVTQALASIKPKSQVIRQQIQNILKVEKANFIQYDLQKSLEE